MVFSVKDDDSNDLIVEAPDMPVCIATAREHLICSFGDDYREWWPHTVTLIGEDVVRADSVTRRIAFEAAGA